MKKIINRLNSWFVIPIFFIFAILLFWVTYTALTYSVFNNRFPVNSSINGQSVSFKKVPEVKKILEDQLKNQEITIKINGEDKQVKFKATDLGFYVDDSTVKQKLSESRKKMLLFSIPIKQSVNYSFDNNNLELAASLESMTASNPDKPINSKFVLQKDGTITTSESQPGKAIDYKKVLQLIKDQESNGKLPSDITAITETVEARIGKESLQQFKSEIDKISKNSYAVKYRDIIIDLDKAAIVGLYEVGYIDGANKLFVNPVFSEQYLTGFINKLGSEPKDFVTYKYKSGRASTTSTAGVNGSKVSNAKDLIAEFIKTLNNQANFNGEATAEIIPFKSITTNIDDTLIKRRFTYSVITWGTVKSDINEFKILAAETLNDPRGWVKANVAFSEVASGGDFTLVLAEPATLPANYPSTCDSTYSCQVGRYVMINDDRWRLATSVWTGTLRDYRHMVVNHETGHWLGQSHKSCPAAGSPAPVMQQQSISLQGCTFNPWPLDSEALIVSNRY